MPAAMLAASRRSRFSPLPLGRSPASRLAMTASQSMWASSVTPSVIEVRVLTNELKSSRCSHPAPMTSSQAASRE